MKRSSSLLLVALLVALVTTPGLAQNLSAGPTVGIGFANWGGDVEGTDSRFGLGIGGSFGFQLHDYFRLAVDGVYVQKGISEEEDGFSIKTKLSYLEFMFPATLTIPVADSPITPRIYLGPALAIETGCKFSAEEGGAEVDVGCDEIFEISEGQAPDFDTKNLDIGLFFGGGVDVAVGSGAISVDIRYNIGLTNINDVEGAEDVSIKNRNLQIVTGYRFFFGG
ncbi:MAG: PorT family protein [Gemmatimonadota bacterium]|nr:MAG: PorT family protein [Gemmatimonadota bacterium]